MVHSAESASAIDTGLSCLVLLARFHGQPCEANQLKHEFAATQHFGDVEILRAAKFLQLKAKKITTPSVQQQRDGLLTSITKFFRAKKYARHEVPIDGANDKALPFSRGGLGGVAGELPPSSSVSPQWQTLSKTPLPTIAKHRDGHYFILAKIDDDKALIQDPLEQRPQTLPRDLFEQLFGGELILVTKRAALPGVSGKFDLSWFIPSIVKYKRILLEVLVASFFLQILGLVSPLFFQAVTDKVLVHQGLSTLDVLCVGLLVVSIFEVLLGILRTYLFSHTTNRIDVELGSKLYKHLLGLPISYFLARPTGTIVARVRELDSIRNFITGSALTLVMDLFFSIVFLAIMYAYSTTLFLIVLLSIPCYIVLSLIVTPIFKTRLDEKFARGAENQSFLTESITAIETVKSVALEPQMRRKWEEQLAGYVAASFNASNLGNISGQIAQLINKVSMLLIMWFGARLVIENKLSMGELIAFNMFAQRVSGPILRLVQLWQDFQQAGISIERIGDILNTPTEPGYNPNRATLPALQGHIQFDNVVFRYRPDASPVIKNISFDVKPNEIIGIVGRSGSGKSTIAKLMQRLYVPEQGRVLIDGVDLAMVEPAWLRRQIGVVPQSCMLFNRSVRENIALIDPTISMDEIIAAAKLAGAHEFILELPEGYDTLVGEHGANLSGGQRQRIAIARALINNPKILIFDEATSALDYESEQIIANNMSAICDGRTVIIIAHRAATLKLAHRIIRIEKGSLDVSESNELSTV